MKKGESPVGIISLMFVVAAIIGVVLVWGVVSIIEVGEKNDQIAALKAQAAPFTKSSDSGDVARVFANAKLNGEQVSYLNADGLVMGSKEEFDTLPADFKAEVQALLDKEGGSIVRQKCYSLQAKDGSWDAGYCTSETLQKFGPGKGPKA